MTTQLQTSPEARALIETLVEHEPISLSELFYRHSQPTIEEQKAIQILLEKGFFENYRDMREPTEWQYIDLFRDLSYAGFITDTGANDGYRYYVTPRGLDAFNLERTNDI